MGDDNRRYWLDAGLAVMGLAALAALAIGASSYLSSEARGFVLVCALSLALVAAAASLPILEGGSRSLATLIAVLCVLDLLGTSIAAFLLKRPATIAAMAIAALGLTDHMLRPRVAAMAPSNAFSRASRNRGP